MANDPAEPARIFLVGMTGSGKTTVGKRLAERMDRPFVDLDDAIEERTHQSIAEIFAQHGEFNFRACEAHVLRDLMRRYPEGVIAVGGGTPLHFDGMAFMNANGLTIFLDVDAEHLIARLAKQRGRRPLLKRDDWETFLRELLEERRGTYGEAAVRVEVEGGDSERAVERILEQLPQVVGH